MHAVLHRPRNKWPIHTQGESPHVFRMLYRRTQRRGLPATYRTLCRGSSRVTQKLQDSRTAAMTLETLGTYAGSKTSGNGVS